MSHQSHFGKEAGLFFSYLSRFIFHSQVPLEENSSSVFAAALSSKFMGLEFIFTEAINLVSDEFRIGY